MNDLIVSIIRTYVPIAVGALIAALGITGIDVDATAATLTSLVAAIYYAVVRLAEARWPVVGVLLGRRKQPEYDQ